VPRHRQVEQGRRLQVNPIACDGVGMCGLIAAELVSFDSWGYPVLTPRRLVGRDLRAAKAAVAGCPRRALFLTS
jgi:ferredoxin